MTAPDFREAGEQGGRRGSFTASLWAEVWLFSSKGSLQTTGMAPSCLLLCARSGHSTMKCLLSASLSSLPAVSDDMKPHPIVVSALTMICAVAPSWRIIPTPDIIDKVCKDPEMRKEVSSNPYIYRGKLPLTTCHELLMVSLDIEKNLNQAIPFRSLPCSETTV
ncbi:hypothetical protein SEVIR_5G378701v4 [Setaria viridis]